MDFVVGNDNFGRNIAEGLGCEYREFRKGYYPDGEPFPRIQAEYEEIEGSKVLVVYRTKQRPTKESVVFYLHNFTRVVNNLMDEKLYRANSVDVLLPYFLLGRQDHNPRTDSNEMVRERDKGKDIGYRYIAKSFKASGASRIVTFNPHFFRRKGSIDVCGIEVVSLSGIPALARYAEDKVSKDAIVISPDFGSSSLAEEFAKLVDREFRILKKQRNTVQIKRKSQTEISYKDVFDAEGCDVVIVDDIFAGFGTIEESISAIRNSGTIDVYGVHAVLPHSGYEKARDFLRSHRIRRLVATNTINSDYSEANVIPEVVGFYRKSRS